MMTQDIEIISRNPKVKIHEFFSFLAERMRIASGKAATACLTGSSTLAAGPDANLLPWGMQALLSSLESKPSGKAGLKRDDHNRLCALPSTIIKNFAHFCMSIQVNNFDRSCYARKFNF
jgi:hypothetical protein